MSDLAPFVAAAIESKVVADLKEENDKLRADANMVRDTALRLAREVGGFVEITGDGGAPVYARSLIDAAELDENAFGVSCFVLGLRNDRIAVCAAGNTLSAEIRVNGVVVAKLRDCDETEEWSEHYGDGNYTQHTFYTGRGTPWDEGFKILFNRDKDCAVEFVHFEFEMSHKNVRTGDLFHDLIQSRIADDEESDDEEWDL
ncbi:hypothetical protein ACHAXT_006999 [Thalassiosira profunda]